MRSVKHGLIGGMFFLFFIGLAAAGTEGEAAEFQPPEDLPPGWYARIETGMGRILVRLLPEQAPQSVAHFAALAEGRLEWMDPTTGETHKGNFYDGTLVHKVKAGFRFEAGDPTGSGRGGPIMYVPKEGLGPVDFSGSGRIGMTYTPGRGYSAYQFFVTYAAQPRLNGSYPCFGEVISGKDIVLEISSVKAYSNGRPIEPIVIEQIRVFPVGDPQPLPDPKPHTPKQKKLILHRNGGKK